MGATRALITIRSRAGDTIYINNAEIAKEYIHLVASTPDCQHAGDAADANIQQRLSLIKPALEAQRAASLKEGRNIHSSRGLLDERQHLLSNIAKHAGFSQDVTLSDLSTRELKKMQKGALPSSDESTCADSHGASGQSAFYIGETLVDAACQTLESEIKAPKETPTCEEESNQQPPSRWEPLVDRAVRAHHAAYPISRAVAKEKIDFEAAFSDAIRRIEAGIETLRR